jgi:hypothetical protein
MPIEPLHVHPGSPALLRRRGTFTPNADRIDAPGREGQECFEADIVFLISNEVVHVPEPLATVEV